MEPPGPASGRPDDKLRVIRGQWCRVGKAKRAHPGNGHARTVLFRGGHASLCPPYIATSHRIRGNPSGSIPALVDHRPLFDPWHHLAQLGADMLDRVLGELGAHRLE